MRQSSLAQRGGGTIRLGWRSSPTNGRAFSPRFFLAQPPGRWPGLGKLPGHWPKIRGKAPEIKQGQRPGHGHGDGPRGRARKMFEWSVGQHPYGTHNCGLLRTSVGAAFRPKRHRRAASANSRSDLESPNRDCFHSKVSA